MTKRPPEAASPARTEVVQVHIRGHGKKIVAAANLIGRYEMFGHTKALIAQALADDLDR